MIRRSDLPILGSAALATMGLLAALALAPGASALAAGLLGTGLAAGTAAASLRRLRRQRA